MNKLLSWYIAGPMIGLIVPMLLILGEKQLGISSSFRWIGSFSFRSLPYLNYNRKTDNWQLVFVLGILIAALLCASLGLIPVQFERDEALYASFSGVVPLLGGVLIGFGSRLANGCTAGHCIMGNSQLSPASLVTTLAFFAGGWLSSNLLIDLIVTR